MRTFAGGNVDWQRGLLASGTMSQLNAVITVGEGTSTNALAAGYYSDGTNGRDFLVVKMNINGNLLWQRTYGAPGTYEEATSIEPAGEEDFVVTGVTSGFGAASFDVWVIKISGADGRILWQRRFGGTNNRDYDYPGAIVQWGSGFALSAMTLSFQGSSPNNQLWVLRLDESGGIDPNCTQIDTALTFAQEITPSFSWQLETNITRDNTQLSNTGSGAFTDTYVTQTKQCNY